MRMTGVGGLRRPAPSFSSLLGNPEDEQYSLPQTWVKNGDKATSPVAVKHKSLTFVDG